MISIRLSGGGEFRIQPRALPRLVWVGGTGAWKGGSVLGALLGLRTGDVYAAKNLVAWYEANESTDSSSGSHASGDPASLVPIAASKAGSLKEEANIIILKGTGG